MLTDSDGEKKELSYWGNNQGIWSYGKPEEYFQFDPNTMTRGYYVASGKTHASDCYANNSPPTPSAPPTANTNAPAQKWGLHSGVGYEFRCPAKPGATSFTALFSPDFSTAYLYLGDIESGNRLELGGHEAADNFASYIDFSSESSFSWHPQTGNNASVEVNGKTVYSGCFLGS